MIWLTTAPPAYQLCLLETIISGVSHLVTVSTYVGKTSPAIWEETDRKYLQSQCFRDMLQAKQNVILCRKSKLLDMISLILTIAIQHVELPSSIEGSIDRDMFRKLIQHDISLSSRIWYQNNMRFLHAFLWICVRTFSVFNNLNKVKAFLNFTPMEEDSQMKWEMYLRLSEILQTHNTYDGQQNAI